MPGSSSSAAIVAANTLGGIAGVFVTGYVLLDVMRISNIFRVMGGLMVLLALICLGVDRAKPITEHRLCDCSPHSREAGGAE